MATSHAMLQLFPEISTERFADLLADIKKKGLLQPIVTHKNQVIDGRARVRACKIAGKAPRYITFGSLGLGNVTPEEYIWSQNFERRQLTEDQRAVVAYQWAEALKKGGKQRQLAALTKGTTPGVVSIEKGKAQPNATRRALAEKASVSTHRIQQLESVTKHAPRLVSKVAAGIMPLREAAKIAQSKAPHKHRKVVVQHITVKQAVRRVISAFTEDAQIIAKRVEDRGAYYETLAHDLTVWCRKMSAKGKSKAA